MAPRDKGRRVTTTRSLVAGRMRLIGSSTVALLVLLAVAACGSGDDETPEAGPSATSTVVAPATESPADRSAPAEEPIAASGPHFERLLTLVPDTPATRSSVVMWDLERLRSHEPLTRSAVDEFLATPLASSFPTPEEFGLGVDLLDHVMEAGYVPDQYFAVSGRYDDALIDRLLRDCASCPRPPEISQHGGETIFAWGADFELDVDSSFAAPAFDRLGRGGRLAVIDGVVFRTNWTDGIRELIDTSQGSDSLSMDDDFLLAVRRLDDLGTYTARISSDTQRRTDDVSEILGSPSSEIEKRRAWDPPAGEPVLPRYDVVARGHGIDESGPYIGIVLIYGSTGGAEAARPLLLARIRAMRSLLTRQRWTDLIDQAEVWVDGRAMIAKLRAGKGVIGFLERDDPLLLHE